MPGAVADVVAHVVGDHGRVARIVLGDVRLDLADEVGADVGALGEDAAAEAREHRDQRAAEREADQRVGLVVSRERRMHSTSERDREQARAHHHEAGHRAALERELERAAEAGLAPPRATRTFARTDTFMPMKPAAALASAPTRKPNAYHQPRNRARPGRIGTPTFATVRYWRERNASAPAADRRGDLVRAVGAGRGGDHAPVEHHGVRRWRARSRRGR